MGGFRGDYSQLIRSSPLSRLPSHTGSILPGASDEILEDKSWESKLAQAVLWEKRSEGWSAAFRLNSRTRFTGCLCLAYPSSSHEHHDSTHGEAEK
ncbi:hypothetical protein CCHR01_16129 [Colletotrichum chrysophilum]|uniref:Uncharacterized protein n=1 Tax=Colletotrichum chrysophilum TaxID=1836956 RepID=A0AAD9A6D9_9PEZI|nr:hypothetical protein CCHR01_16129 [Colletotrichum chrysophilum]